jgi:hypothetical protein
MLRNPTTANATVSLELGNAFEVPITADSSAPYVFTSVFDSVADADGDMLRTVAPKAGGPSLCPHGRTKPCELGIEIELTLLLRPFQTIVIEGIAAG